MPTEKSKNYSKSSPPQQWDYIVIGSGMGGMTSAAFLAQLGYKVLVLEQHYVPGGYTHTFRRTDWRWDVGVHAVGEVTAHSMSGRLLQKLTNGRLQWAPLGECYDEFYFPDGFRIDFPNTPEKFRENLLAAFPEEAQAIDAYLHYVKRVAKAMRSYYLSRTLPHYLGLVWEKLFARDAYRFLRQHTQQVLASLTSNERLKTVIAAQWGYYGSTPSQSSFAIQALVARHFAYGGYYPVGGAQKIAQELLRTIAKAGGWTRIRSGVEKILVQKQRAVGVKLENGEEIYARRIISAVGAKETITHLLNPKEQQQNWAQEIQKLDSSPAHVCLYLGFKGDIQKAGASASNKWFWETWDCEFDNWDFHNHQTLAPVLYTSFPSLKDPQHQPGPDLLHTGEVVTFVPYSAFSQWEHLRVMKRGEEYQQLKEELSQRLLQQLFQYMPQLEPLIAYRELSTPISSIHYTRAAAGSIYGLAPTPERFENRWLKPRTPIKNLYLSGSDVATVGVIGAAAGGALAAIAAEPRKAIGFLRRVAKK